MNAEETPLSQNVSDVVLLGQAGATMRRLLAELEEIKARYDSGARVDPVAAG